MKNARICNYERLFEQVQDSRLDSSAERLAQLHYEARMYFHLRIFYNNKRIHLCIM